MSLWTIAVPLSAAPTGKPAAELAQACSANATVTTFNIPPLKVGTLDQLMTISEETTKMDTFVGGVAKKIEKTYFDTFKAEAQEMRDKQTAGAAAGAATGSSGRVEENAPELRIDGKTALEYVMSWRWNEVRYPTRSALPLLISIIMKDTTKSDEALKKQVAEYNEVRTSYTAIERKDAGTLLVKPLGQYVKQPPIETQHLTTLMLVVPKARQQEFLDTYETLEVEAARREAEEAARKAAEAEERRRKDAERAAEREEKEAALQAQKTPAQLAHEAARAAEKAAAEEKEAEARRVEAEIAARDPTARAREEQERAAREEEEKRRSKRLPKGCLAVVPRSAQVLANEPGDEFVLFSVVVLRQGAEQYKNLCREKRYTVRPFKFDPEEDRQERERKQELAKKKKNLFNFLIRWCTTTYVEVFTAWIHLKAIRLYVESVLRYGLPYQCQAMIVHPQKGREKLLRDILKQLYARLAGNNANLTTALDPNEPDLSGLGSDFYSYVYLPLNLND